MGNMNVVPTKRFMSFSAEGQDIVRAGVELYKHYLYLNGKQQYAESATGRTYEEKQEIFTKNLINESLRMAGVSVAGASEAVLLRNPNVKWALFSLVGEILDVIIPQTILEDFYKFAEVRNGNWGDSFVFTVPNPDLFVVSKIAPGVRKAEPQRIYNGILTLIPQPRAVTIQEDFYRVLAGKVNWGDWVARVARSFETQITTDIYNAILNSYNNLPTQLKVTGFTPQSFIQLVQRVEALNAGAKAAAFGTKLALSQILPADQYLKFALGEEYNKYGYLTNFQGVDLFEIPQRIIAGTYDFAIDNNTIYVVSMGSDKIAKIAFEGEAIVTESTASQNADMTVDYTFIKSYDVGVITSARYGIIKLA